MGLYRIFVRRRATFLLLLAIILLFCIQLRFQFRFQAQWSSRRPRKSQNVTHFWHTDPRLAVYLSLLRGPGLPVFLIDPIAVFPLIPSASREWISRDTAIKNLFVQYDSKDLAEPPSTILAGIATNDTGSDNLTLSQVIQMISVIGQDAEFRVQVAQDEPPTQFHVNTGNENIRVLPTHVVLTKNRYTLHIVLFHPVVNTSFFWTSPFKKPFYDIGFQTQDPFNIPLPHRASIFDEFGIQTADLEFPNGRNGTLSVEVLIPLSILHFVQQLPHSSYVECNRAVAAEFQQKYSANFSEEQQTVADTNSRYTLLQIKDILKASFIPFWACFGTMLGWWRECSAIPYTTDLDFCSFSSFTKDDGLVDEIVKYMRTGKTIDYFWTYGLPGDGLEMVFETVPEPTTNSSFRADLFFVHSASKAYIGKPGRRLPPQHGLHSHVARRNTMTMDERNQTSTQGITTGEKEEGWIVYIHWYTSFEYQFYHFPSVRDFCSTDLWGLKVMVPCDPIPSLENDYGKEVWKLPKNEDFEYGGNISVMFKWDEAQQGKVFGQYPINYGLT